MKDYLAKNISFDVWKKILRSSLPDEAENVIHAITSSRRREPYDRSYAAIRKLVETDIVTNASRMETLVKRFHVTEAKKFGKKFLEGWYLLYSFRKRFLAYFYFKPLSE